MCLYSLALVLYMLNSRDENVDLVADLPLGSFISLRNVRCKISSAGILEGAIHTDRIAFTKAVQILPQSHPAVLEIKKYFYSLIYRRSQKHILTKAPTSNFASN